MSERFSIATVAGWGDMDANAHMANVACLNKCVDARMSFFEQCGFPASEFAKRRLGPVVRRDEVEYFREVSLLEPITVTLALGGWLDLTTPRLTAPPPDVLTALQRLPHTEDFEELPSSLRT